MKKIRFRLVIDCVNWPANWMSSIYNGYVKRTDWFIIKQYPSAVLLTYCLYGVISASNHITGHDLAMCKAMII